jgi:hypothetical protein
VEAGYGNVIYGTAEPVPFQDRVLTHALKPLPPRIPHEILVRGTSSHADSLARLFLNRLRPD